MRTFLYLIAILVCTLGGLIVADAVYALTMVGDLGPGTPNWLPSALILIAIIAMLALFASAWLLCMKWRRPAAGARA